MDTCLSLDLGTKTGFCVFEHSEGFIEVFQSGTKDFQQLKGASIGRKFACFRDWLVQIIKKYHIKTVYFEQVFRHSGVQPAHVYGGFLYHLAAICDDYNIGVCGIGVCTIKKTVTGYGHASKDEIIQAVRQYDFKPIDDNEADAIAIALTVQERSAQ